MKKAIAALLIFALAALMAVPTLATTGSIGKYTPALDAEKDEAYDQSISVNLYAGQDLDTGEIFHSEGDAPDSNSGDATAWFLYDDDYVYIYVEVKDSDVFDIGKDLFDSRENNYQSDSIELWFVFGDEPFVKYSTVAYNHGSFGQEGDDLMYGGSAEELGYGAVSKIISGGWAAEYKVPIKKYGLKQGDTFYFTLQHNNMDSGENLVVSGRQLMNGGEDAASALTLGDPIVIAAPEPEPEPEPEPAPAEEAPAPPVADVPVATSPTTGNVELFAIFALGLAAILCYAGAVAKKRG